MIRILFFLGIVLTLDFYALQSIRSVSKNTWLTVLYVLCSLFVLGNIIYQAMSLVPAAVKGFFDLVVNQYLPPQAMRDFDNEYRAINHAQIELVAGRVSALNQCVY